MADGENSRLDDAARAGWLYYIAGKTQDEIAQTLNVSRPTAQRLVSICRSEGLITFRMHHPIADCMDLAARLIERYGLVHCDVVPSDGSAASSLAGTAEAAAIVMERQLRSKNAIIIALGTGRSMRASVQRVSPMSAPMHRLVALVGNIGPDGSASPFDALTKLSEITGALRFPMLLPLFMSTTQERDQLLDIAAVKRSHALAADADIWITGISQIDTEATLFLDGFITRDELFEMIRLGAVGEIAGWAFDANGQIIENGSNLRVTSVRPQMAVSRPRICVAAGPQKLTALRAALTGRLINGLITDEATAQALL